MGMKLRAVVRSVLGLPLMALLTGVLAIYLIVLGSIRRDSPQNEKIVQFWSKVFLSRPPLRYDVEGRELIDVDQPKVYVSNHLSMFDIPLLLRAVPQPMRFVAKKELFKIPLLGWVMNVLGVVKVDRKAGISAHQAMNIGVTSAAERGLSLLVFAEGTRSRDGEMHGFKKGAFYIAIDHQLTLVPVTVAGTFDVMPPKSRLFYPGHARVVIHEPIDTTGMTRDDVIPLMEQTRNTIAKTFEELRETG